jgi:hypothetical protein
VTAAYESAVLTVTGPGDYTFRREFGKNEMPAFSLGDQGQAVLEDGQYAWELRFSPVIDGATQEALRAARESGDVSEVEALRKQGKIPSEPLVVSGYFRVAGSWILADEIEVPFRGGEESAGSADMDLPTKDQVILDDLIVDGSACIGFDCINGESFGFDTIRLKENNVRIKFFDTSSSASFPSNDWQLTANDSSNGGANKFSIDDIDGGRTPFTIEAGAPSHSLYVDDGGRLGFGTNTPVVELHVKDGDTPTLRLEQDGSSGFTPQTWDLAGNETNFFIRDVTNGSTLPFRIRPGAPTSALDIAASGNIGIGTTSPDKQLDIEASGPSFRLTNTGGGGGFWDFKVNAGSGRLNMTDDPAGSRSPFKIGLNANDNLVRVGIPSADTVTISGTLDVTGSVIVDSVTVHPDYVFGSEYELESISEHAEFMWQRKHLPALSAAGPDGTGSVDLVSHQMGILEELEKAHIYIQQLHERLEELENRLEATGSPAE